jgi:hypothetical protein
MAATTQGNLHHFFGIFGNKSAICRRMLHARWCGRGRRVTAAPMPIWPITWELYLACGLVRLR